MKIKITHSRSYALVNSWWRTTAIHTVSWFHISFQQVISPKQFWYHLFKLEISTTPVGAIYCSGVQPVLFRNNRFDAQCFQYFDLFSQKINKHSLDHTVFVNVVRTKQTNIILTSKDWTIFKSRSASVSFSRNCISAIHFSVNRGTDLNCAGDNWKHRLQFSDMGHCSP